jgi:hypothetical protein
MFRENMRNGIMSTCPPCAYLGRRRSRLIFRGFNPFNISLSNREGSYERRSGERLSKTGSCFVIVVDISINHRLYYPRDTLDWPHHLHSGDIEMCITSGPNWSGLSLLRMSNLLASGNAPPICSRPNVLMHFYVLFIFNP